MSKSLSRGTDLCAQNLEILQRLSITAELLVACDFEGTLSDPTDDALVAHPLKGSMRVLSALASLPRTSAAIIAQGSVARVRGSHGLSGRVTIIERCAVESVGDRQVTSLRPPTLRKDLAIDGLLAHHSPTLIFFAGDDESDEAVFTALGIDDIGCKIGHGDTSAAMRLRSPRDLVAFLERLRRKRKTLIDNSHRVAI